MTANLCLTCMVLILYTLLHKSPTATCTSGIVPESSHTSSVSDTTQQEHAKQNAIYYPTMSKMRASSFHLLCVM